MNEARLELLRMIVGQERQRAGGDANEQAGHTREVRLALATKAGGLVSFEIVGVLMGLLVFASWDGFALTVSEELYESSLFSLALERLSGAPDRAGHAAHVLDDPRSIAIRLVQHLDHVVRIEYGNWCDRSRRKRTWFLDGAHAARPSGVCAH
ncbi:MAG: hypothetical protein ABSF33_09475 [Acidimicrobiales bacterium]|jgi:hypothetical protein